MAGFQTDEIRFRSVSFADAVARSRRHRWAGPIVAATISTALIGIGMALSEDSRWGFIAEGGPIENLAIVGYAALFLALLVTSHRHRTVPSAIVVLLMTARELDMHKAFTSDSIFSLRTYTGDAAPLAEKLVGAVTVIAIVAFVIRYAARYGPWLWRHAKAGSSAAYAVVTGIVLLISAKVCDAFARTFQDLTGIQVHTGTWLQLIEEAFESTAPFVFLWAVFAGYGAARATTACGSRPSPCKTGGEGSR